MQRPGFVKIFFAISVVAFAGFLILQLLDAEKEVRRLRAQNGKLEIQVSEMEQSILSLKRFIYRPSAAEDLHDVPEMGIYEPKEEPYGVGHRYDDHKKPVTAYIEEHIGELVTEKPSRGSSFVVDKLLFLYPDIVYVRYEDGHYDGGICLRVDKASEDGIEITRFAG